MLQNGCVKAQEFWYSVLHHKDIATPDWTDLKKALDYEGSDKFETYLNEAFCHPSINEDEDFEVPLVCTCDQTCPDIDTCKKKVKKLIDYNRMSCSGDALLMDIITREFDDVARLIERSPENVDEKSYVDILDEFRSVFLAEEKLVKVAEKLELEKYLLIFKDKKKTMGPKEVRSVKASLVLSLLAAVQIDSGKDKEVTAIVKDIFREEFNVLCISLPAPISLEYDYQDKVIGWLGDKKLKCDLETRKSADGYWVCQLFTYKPIGKFKEDFCHIVDGISKIDGKQARANAFCSFWKKIEHRQIESGRVTPSSVVSDQKIIWTARLNMLISQSHDIISVKTPRDLYKEYRAESETEFTAEIRIHGIREPFGKGKGRNKKAARERAAENAFKKVEIYINQMRHPHKRRRH